MLESRYDGMLASTCPQAQTELHRVLKIPDFELELIVMEHATNDPGEFKLAIGEATRNKGISL